MTHDWRYRSNELYPGVIAYGDYAPNGVPANTYTPKQCILEGFRQATYSKTSPSLWPTVKRWNADKTLPVQYQKAAKAAKALLDSQDWGSGPFFSEKRHVVNSHPFVQMGGKGPFGFFYTGPLLAYGSVAGAMTPFQTNVQREAEVVQMFAKGSDAIKRSMPGQSEVDLLLAAGELRKDGLPSIPGAQLLMGWRRPVKELSGEYLNFMFGVKPLVSDLAGLARIARSQAQVIQQMTRDGNRRVRRRYNYPPEKTVATTVMSTTARPGSWGNLYAGGISSGTLTRVTRTESEWWFSGAFQQYIPQGDTLLEKSIRVLDETDRLIGVKPTPEVIWNLSAWTWLFDWFVSAGSAVSNLSRMGSDRIIMQYGYIMHHTLVENKYILTGCRVTASSGYNDVPINRIETIAKYERKARAHAFPYGFGVTWSDLTETQSAILTALGLSRTSRF
jgi:hypothetical protein